MPRLKRTSRSHRINPKIWTHHLKALEDAWRQCIQTPLHTAFTHAVLVITLLLAVVFLQGFEMFQRVAQSLTFSNQISVYLKSDISENRIHIWLQQLKTDDLVQEATYISPTQALKELSKEISYQNILNSIEDNPLPPVVLIKLRTTDKERVTAFANGLKNIPLIESFNIDFDWLQRLSAVIELGDRLCLILGILLTAGVILIVSHAIETATQKNQQEMHLLQVMGASWGYIRRPFLYVGTLLGISAGFITLLLALLLSLLLSSPLHNFLRAYDIPILPSFSSWHTAFSFLIVSGFLGWLGAQLAFYKART